MTPLSPPAGSATPRHTSVLLNEVIDALAPRDGAVYVDATFGAGGYSKAILEAADCTVWGIDRDSETLAQSADLVASFEGRLTVLNGPFGDMARLLDDVGVEAIDGIALDLGVSSMQIDEPERGFSFRADGPLDMRMAQSGMTAAQAVNQLDETELANIIYRYGEERLSRRVAKAIVETRAETPITRTGQLAALVRRVVRKSKDGIDPATRTFQALRIYVNDELGELERGLNAAEKLLRPGGRLCVVAFHSLEDRQVKEFLKSGSGMAAKPSRHLPVQSNMDVEPPFRLLSKRVVKPTAEETAANPRARSARLRAAERTAAPYRRAA
ncbi:MAG: 16S rRNA (cytosine(1402)-N(4))-methyltransferase RsmH [Alphaproteobacteria bacterium]|jgi:16S rRNA (cytosine1402-N4)-methyltransferase|nr:16S rRNA (cytosine(1402)-N(4))-methyltransferase RsmH [Alphaproteobacteria bacterium]MBT7943061.1 16S rRNA (cytosine(1402)-N(4))-methyltransferase RsmH [Alphaproteobacteria bacterium]